MPVGNRIILPLAGLKAAVACSAEKSGRLVSGLRSLGATVVQLPVIGIRETEDKRALDEAISKLKSYSWIIVTSSYAARILARRMCELGHDAAMAGLDNICAIGPGTAATLRESGLKAALVPEDYVAEGILRALAARHGGMEGLAGMRILLPRAKEARDLMPEELKRAGVQLEIVTCYETIQGVVDPETLRAMRSNPPDLLVFTSSSAVRNLAAIVGRDEGIRMMSKSTVAVLGPITARTVESFGITPKIQPHENTITSLLEAVRNHYLNASTRHRSGA